MHHSKRILLIPLLFICATVGFAAEEPGQAFSPNGIQPAEILQAYHDEMCVPKPLLIRKGKAFEKHKREMRQILLRCVGLDPFPERIDLDIRMSEPLDHPWCTIHRVAYQIVPDVYVDGLLFMPKKFREQPAPGMLCPHGHWEDGNANPTVQKRCLTFAWMGYVVFSPTQNHYEDLVLGISNQTVMVWGNMRALDFLQSLPEVDPQRIGCCGCSGGGMQTEMLQALVNRVKAATIVGMTCDFKDIIWTAGAHCPCNHFPGVMRWTGHPEISTLGFPTPVQIISMNDFTRNFKDRYKSIIPPLYDLNYEPGGCEIMYWDTPQPTHDYNRSKRERTYWWMERWLRGRDPTEWPSEPDIIKTFAVEELQNLKAPMEDNQGFGGMSRYFEKTRGYQAPSIENRKQWRIWKKSMLTTLKDLLGVDAILPSRISEPLFVNRETTEDVIMERFNFPSEGDILVPAIVLRPKEDRDRHLPVKIILATEGKEALLKEVGPESPGELARQGQLVVLADTRFVSEYDLREISFGGKPSQMNLHGWMRNAILWGRPHPAMAATDLSALLDGLQQRSDTNIEEVTLIARDGGVCAGALFATAMDERITAVELDFEGRCFKKRSLPMVPFVLQHGDILQWTALAADRRVQISNVPPEAGDPQWLRKIFETMGNGDRLDVIQQ